MAIRKRKRAEDIKMSLELNFLLKESSGTHASKIEH